MKLILIVVDTLRADHLGCYGYPRDTTPNIDELARDSTVFLEASSAFTCTLPSFTSIFTGLYPTKHGVVVNPHASPNVNDRVLDDRIPTLPEILLDAGFVTAAIDNLINFASHPKWFVRGFEYYINVTRSSGRRHHHVTADEVNARLLPWVRGHATEDFFLFVHYWDPHAPYNQPPPYRRIYQGIAGLEVKKAARGCDYVVGVGPREWISNAEEQRLNEYDGEIRYVDERIGDLLLALNEEGISEETAIILTADHGVLMAEKPGVSGIRGIWHPTMHIPLIIRLPGGQAQVKVTSAFAHHVDIMPTILEVLGVDFSTQLDGTSLLTICQGKEKSVRDELFGEGSYLGVPQRYLRRGRWKLIKNYIAPGQDWKPPSALELYDMERDPEETVNMGDSFPQILNELETGLQDRILALISNNDDPFAPDRLAQIAEDARTRYLYN